MEEWINDITTADSKGNIKLIPSKTAAWLMEQNNFITMEGTEKLLLYDSETGAWKANAEQKIKNTMQTQLDRFISRNVVNEVIEHIRRTEYAAPSIINAKPDLINLKNGVYDVESKTLLPHSKDYYFSYTLPFSYNARAEPETFMTFLPDICSYNLDDIVTVIEGFAYSFIPGYPIQRANMLVGNGANGKGTLLNVLQAFVGEENCAHLTLQTLSRQTGFALARLHGKLLNIGADLPAEGVEDAGNFKSLTGGDMLDADVKYQQDAVQLRNGAKLWYSANQIPASHEDTKAYYRRWNILKFKKEYKEGHNILPDLTSENELQGIFNLVMEFYPYIKSSLKYTFAKEYEEVRRDYLKSSDTVQFFAEDCLSYEPEADVPKTEVYDAYIKFCDSHGLIKVGSEESFWRRLRFKVTFTEHIPFRGGPRYVKGQKLIELYEEPEQPQEDTKTILDTYLDTHHLHQVHQHFSLLLYNIDFQNFTTKSKKPDEPDALDALDALDASTKPDLPPPSTPNTQVGAGPSSVVTGNEAQDSTPVGHAGAAASAGSTGRMEPPNNDPRVPEQSQDNHRTSSAPPGREDVVTNPLHTPAPSTSPEASGQPNQSTPKDPSLKPSDANRLCDGTCNIQYRQLYYAPDGSNRLMCRDCIEKEFILK